MFVVLAGCVGLVVGSLICFASNRLPAHLYRSWHNECRELLATPNPKPFKKWLAARQFVASLTAVCSVAVAWRFGADPVAMIAALLLTWTLVVLACIDVDYHLLPDTILMSVMWVGLCLSLFDIFVDSSVSVTGSIVGYLALWGVYQLIKFFTGKETIGHGDFKLLALLGAWMGWQPILTILLLSSLTGGILGATLVLMGKQSRDTPVPFGPFLAASGWIVLIFGDPLSPYL